jgi:hypothetical protein
VLAASGALGFHLGAGAFADWQVAVESAQVVAGLVDYPPGNPFYVYHTKLWTILHQVLAPALAAGIPERMLSIVLSGLLGMVSFQALSLVVFAFSRDVLLSVGAAALIFFSRLAEGGAVYPIWLVGTTHTYGILALSYAALVIGFLGCGWTRTAAFLLGLAPAVHPSVGAWLLVVAALVVATDFRRLGRELALAVPAFLYGFAVTLASLLVQRLFIHDVPALDGAAGGKYLAAFVSFWDVHRQPVDFANATVRINAVAFVAGVMWLWWLPDRLPKPAILLIRFIVATAALSLVLAVVSHIPPDRLPPPLVILMPGRLLNLNMLLVSGLLLGVAGAQRRTAAGSALLVLICVMLLIGNRSGLWTFDGDHRTLGLDLPRTARPNETSILIFGVLLQLAVARWAAKADARRRFVTMTYAGTLVVLALSALLTWSLERPRAFDMADRTNDQLFRMLAEGEGLIATGGELHIVQLRTRRPVLIDGGGLDALPYTIEAAPEMERILRDVYGIELLDPPEEARYRGTIPPAFTQSVWQSYTRDQWQQIGARYGVTQVLTPGDWDLHLPVAVRKGTLTVYDIPRPISGSPQ